MKRLIRHCALGLSVGLSNCNEQPVKEPVSVENHSEKPTGIRPNIVVGDIDPQHQTALMQWIDEAVSLLKSPEFEANFKRASQIYADVYVSKTQDVIKSERLLGRLKTNDPSESALWWPKTYVILSGAPATRSSDRNGFGFEADRTAAARPYPTHSNITKTGEIELGQLHFARYTHGDAVEKSCAINTMVHEISHSLSDREDQFWMHILDSEENVTPPRGVFEASYFIGVIAQCTYLQSIGRMTKADFHACMLTFSDPDNSSRFKSLACDDFPNNTAITPSGRLP